MMEKCDCTRTEHCIKALKSYIMTYDLMNNQLDEEIVKEIKKMLDSME